MTSVTPATTARLSRRATGVADRLRHRCRQRHLGLRELEGQSHFDDATVYTTAKNAVAGLLPGRARTPDPDDPDDGGPGRTAGRRTASGSESSRFGVHRRKRPVRPLLRGALAGTATQAAFIHKSLVVWVAILAVVLLQGAHRAAARRCHRARRRRPGAGSSGGGSARWTFGAGEAMILGATLLWAAEVILAKGAPRRARHADPRRGAHGPRHRGARSAGSP